MQLSSLHVEQKEPSVWELTIEVPVEEVTRVVEDVYRQLSHTVNVPGFRPGHVPKGMLKRWLGNEQFQRMVLEKLIPDALSTAINQKDLDPIVSPDFREVQFRETQPLRFVAEIITRPEVKLCEYKDITLKTVKAEVTEEMVQQEMENLRKGLATYEPTDEPAHEGDKVGVRYQIIPEDGQPSEQWQSGTYVVGVEGWVPPLPTQLAGRKIGDEGEFDFTYPEDYSDPKLIGKKVKVRFVVERVLKCMLPELTEELVRQELAMNGLDELRKNVLQNLQSRLQRAVKKLDREQLENELLKRCSITLPNALVNRFVNQHILLDEINFRRRGLSLEEILKYGGKTMDEYRDKLRTDIEWVLKLRFITEAIAEKENISVSDEEVERLAQEEKGTEELGEDMSTLRHKILEEKVMELLLAMAQRTDEWIYLKGAVEP